jgi:hypothetical protein
LLFFPEIAKGLLCYAINGLPIIFLILASVDIQLKVLSTQALVSTACMRYNIPEAKNIFNSGISEYCIENIFITPESVNITKKYSQFSH